MKICGNCSNFIESVDATNPPTTFFSRFIKKNDSRCILHQYKVSKVTICVIPNEFKYKQ